VVGFDMRGFGESEGPRALITNPQDMLNDARNFIDAVKVWQFERLDKNLPWIGYGYSLGSCYLIGVIQYLQRFPNLLQLFKSMMVVSP
jgi:alpha-beta hydrolase superfamily lysophospholipase